MSKGRIWVVDDDSAIRWVLERTIKSANLDCDVFSEPTKVLIELQTRQPDVLITDLRMPNMDGLSLLKQLKIDHPNLPVIVMTAHSDLDAAVSAYQEGAFEYLPKPFDIDEALNLIERALLQAKKQIAKTNLKAPTSPSAEMLGEAPAMQDVFRAIGRLSRSSISVLITGESGTGKELVAKALHRHSPRTNKPFIALNMAAIPKDLIESELFGHEKGAFTGANSLRQGRFEQANGGTLFLDEIGDMPLEIQTRLLRVLAEGQFYPVGAHQAKKVDVRIIAATHQDLKQQVNKGYFREDLFHRLNVIHIPLPPLRERKEDIAQLAEHFLQSAASELDVDAKRLEQASLEKLIAFNWPGNVRQLQNICRWLTVMASGKDILPSDLPAEIIHNNQTLLEPSSLSWQQALTLWAKTTLNQGEQGLLTKTQPEFERILLKQALEHSQGNKQKAAKLLGWGRNTLTRKLKELSL